MQYRLFLFAFFLPLFAFAEMPQDYSLTVTLENNSSSVINFRVTPSINGSDLLPWTAQVGAAGSGSQIVSNSWSGYAITANDKVVISFQKRVMTSYAAWNFGTTAGLLTLESTEPAFTATASGSQITIPSFPASNATVTVGVNQ